MKIFPVVRESVIKSAMISKCVKMLSGYCTMSGYWSGIRVAICFLNIAVAFIGRFSSTLIFPTSDLDVS